jgi:ferredoxin-NADP reductase
VSVKQEVNGKGSTFLSTRVKSGDVLEVSAPRGSFTLQPGDGPVVLLSAGLGATPVLAMLHDLAASRSPREVWWLHGARNAAEHPFAREARDLAAALPRARSFVAFSRPASQDRLGEDYDASGRLSLKVLQQLGVPRQPTSSVARRCFFAASRRIHGLGRRERAVHQEVFGPEESVTPGVSRLCPAAASAGGSPGPARWSFRAEQSRCAMESCMPEPAGICRVLDVS